VALTLPISTERLLLRRFRDDDRGRFLEYRRDEETARHQGWTMPYTDELADAFFAEMTTVEPWRVGEWFQVAIEHDGVLVGDVGVCAGDPVEVGYTLHPDSRGHGYAGEAVRALVAAAGVDAIAHIEVANVDSQRVAERIGFVREDALVDGEYAYRLAIAGVSTLGP
jgi:RimJ/RimL family protein N-acetyltransferase